MVQGFICGVPRIPPLANVVTFFRPNPMKKKHVTKPGVKKKKRWPYRIFLIPQQPSLYLQ